MNWSRNTIVSKKLFSGNGSWKLVSFEFRLLGVLMLLMLVKLAVVVHILMKML